MSTSLPVASVSEVPGVDLLNDAYQLFAEGHVVAAGMIARHALETCLRRLCDSHDCLPSRKRLRFGVKDALCNALTKSHAVDKATAREARRLFDVGSSVVHGQDVPAHAIETLLQDVRQFVDDVLAVEGGVAK